MDTPMGEKMLSIANVVLRVPPLFIIDELLRTRLGSSANDSPQYESNYCNKLEPGCPVIRDDSNVQQESFLMQQFNVDVHFYENYLMVTLQFLACFIACWGALCIFVLSTRQLVVVYLYLISIGVIFVSYWSNVSTVKAIVAFLGTQGSPPSILDDVFSLNFTPLMSYGPGFLIIENNILQCLLAFVFCYIHLGPRYAIVQKLLALSFLAPSILGIVPVPTSVLHSSPVFATLVPLAMSTFVLWYDTVGMLATIDDGCRRAQSFIVNYGLSALVETEWSRLNVPNVLRTFWILRIGEQVVELVGLHYGEDTFTYYAMMKSLLVNGCETLPALLGMTSIISYICHYIGCFSQWVLMTEDQEEKNFGTVSAVLFYILALQTGLTSLDSEKRLARLYRNFCLLFAAVLHFIHNIVNPLLMSLSASHNPSLHRHIRALAVCAVLVIFPVSLLACLWSHFTISTWLLAVSVFSVEVIVKVIVSLAIYSLFLYDAYRSVFWEQLDDYVYMIRSFGNTVEFSFGIVLFFNGFWMLAFESGGVIRAVMMCIHAYFNIWCDAKAGWSVFIKRRTAVHKINSLPEARVEQLRALNDVCAICYQDMQTAKVTRCNHYFHGVCLRKWLYIQDRCPLCHDILYKVPDNAEAEAPER